MTFATLEDLEQILQDPDGTARIIARIVAGLESQFVADDGMYVAALSDWDTVKRFYLEV